MQLIECSMYREDYEEKLLAEGNIKTLTTPELSGRIYPDKSGTAACYAIPSEGEKSLVLKGAKAALNHPGYAVFLQLILADALKITEKLFISPGPESLLTAAELCRHFGTHFIAVAANRGTNPGDKGCMGLKLC